MLGVFIGSAALIIILSVFNGFESLVLSMYDNYSPDLKIEATKGKTFNPNQSSFQKIKKDKSIASYTEVLQEKALLRYDNLQFIGKIKGVDDNFLKNTMLDSSLVEGEFLLKDKNNQYAIIGSTVRYTLGVNINNPVKKLEIYSPIKGNKTGFTPADEFISEHLIPVGVFQAQQEDNNLVIMPLSVARTLLGEPQNVSYIEIFLEKGVDINKIQKSFENQLGKGFNIKDRIQQNELLYKILNSEKWAVYLILTFVLIIAIFNIIGSLTMLVIDKRKDIAILNSLGAPKKMIGNIFLLEGLMIAMIGCVLGLFVGFIFSWLQQEYGLISMGQENLLIQAYPVEIKFLDFVLVFATVFFISLFASYISSGISIKRFEKLKEDL